MRGAANVARRGSMADSQQGRNLLVSLGAKVRLARVESPAVLHTILTLGRELFIIIS